jgi:hypothetical protein
MYFFFVLLFGGVTFFWRRQSKCARQKKTLVISSDDFCVSVSIVYCLFIGLDVSKVRRSTEMCGSWLRSSLPSAWQSVWLLQLEWRKLRLQLY